MHSPPPGRQRRDGLGRRATPAGRELCRRLDRLPENPALPPWDPALFWDLSRITKPELPEAQRVDGPVTPLRHPDHRVGTMAAVPRSPKSKAAELKKPAQPGGMAATGSRATMPTWRHIWRSAVQAQGQVVQDGPEVSGSLGRGCEYAESGSTTRLPPNASRGMSSLWR